MLISYHFMNTTSSSWIWQLSIFTYTSPQTSLEFGLCCLPCLQVWKAGSTEFRWHFPGKCTVIQSISQEYVSDQFKSLWENKNKKNIYILYNNAEPLQTQSRHTLGSCTAQYLFNNIQINFSLHLRLICSFYIYLAFTFVHFVIYKI